MTVPLRTSEELHAAPALATLPALSTCIEAFVAALALAHPCLLVAPIDQGSDREHAARMLHMHLDACQHLLHLYDQLTFDATYWYCLDPEQEDEKDELEHDADDDIPF
jgi:hypothetical protein